MFFLALYSVCFFLALLAVMRQSTPLWIMTGIVIGCAMITRSNALTLLFLLAAPFTTRENIGRKLRNVVLCLLAFAVVIGSWAMYARNTGSPVSPAYGYVNLAMRYFPTEGDPFSVRARQELRSRFNSYMDVMTHDPVHVVREYLKDAWRMVRRNFFTSELMPFSWSLVGLAGVVLLFRNWHTPFGILFLLSTLAQIGLVNFKSYEPRFYLFLLPLLGAGLGFCLQTAFNYVKGPRIRMVVWVLVVVLVLPNVRWTYKRAKIILHKQDQELGEATGSIRHITDLSGDYVIASLKPHIPYYTGVEVYIDDGYAKLPEFATSAELRQWLMSLTDRGTVYIYFGSYERNGRPGLKYLGQPYNAPSWLEPLIYGGAGKGWAFYRFRPELAG